MTIRFEARIASPKNALDIFPGQWCSNVPFYGGGPAELFLDDRIRQFDQEIGGFYGKKVIELGPLEGGHSYGMSLLGATEILAIEANQDAFLRCLVVKELLNLNVKFLCGDFEKYLKANPPRVDAILASGVLYHMKEPLELIEAMCKVADQICIWTHFYDKDILESSDHLKTKFGQPEILMFQGREIVAAKQSYLSDLNRADFAGGIENYSYWISLDGLQSAFDAVGFNVSVIAKQETHPNGPGITFVAKRRTA